MGGSEKGMSDKENSECATLLEKEEFWHFFYDSRLPNMVMSRDPRSKFRNIFMLS